MDKIPYLYDGINFNSLPKEIFNELATHSNDREFISQTNDKGEIVTVEGKLLRPIFVYFGGDYNFYINLRHYEYLKKRLSNGNCFDKDYNKLNAENIYPFYKYYNDGFFKGYNEFENSLQNNTSLFNITNEQLAYKIYSRVTFEWGFLKERDGGFKLVNDSSSNKKIDEKICKENSIKFSLKIYEENFFQNGVDGGEFYKAWEIILNNPTLFESFFKEKEKSKKKKLKKESQEAEINPQKNKSTTEIIKKNEQKNWFKVGLLFATGEITTLLKTFDNNASAIARHKGNNSFRPHITESLGASKKTSNQSVYFPANFKVIYNYCKENNIIITPEFEAYFKEIETIIN